MTKSSSLFNVDAPPHPSWHDVQWHEVNQQVKRLQVRIVKATKEGRWRKVKNLQRLLTHATAARLLAVRRVTENRGKNTPGVDGETWSTPERKIQAAMSLTKRGYRPKPLKRVYIPKSNGKHRPLGIPTMKDRAMQALHLLGLDPIAETTADPTSYGFRKERSVQDAVERAFTALSNKDRAQWVLEGDIKSCFDNINHDWLISNVPMDKEILRKWLKAGYMEQGVLNNTDAGTPQGGIISPVLANIALDGLQKVLKARFPKRWRNHPKVNLVRYADDFIITGSTKELLEEEVKPVVRDFLEVRGLELSEAKTKVTHIDQGLDFLGFNLRKYSGKLLITPSKEAIKAFKRKFSETLAGMKTSAAGNVIAKLNPIISGWAEFYRHAVSQKVFNSLDRWVFWKLWFWAVRRHRNKSRRWIFRKYFLTGTGARLYGELDGKRINLVQMGKLPIRRHTAVRSEANPYDPEFEAYFESRMDKRWAMSLESPKVKALYKRQKGLCPSCKEKITLETRWHTHHLLYRSKGGPDTLNNLALYHPNCHRQLHSRDKSASEPGVK